MSEIAEKMPVFKQEDRKFYLHCAIGLILLFGIGLLPPLEPITRVGMRLIGIFVGLIYLWSTVGTLWPSLLGIVAVGLSGYSDFNSVIASSFGNSTTIMMIFIMALLGAIDLFGINQYICRWFLTLKVINGRPWIFSIIWLSATFILGTLGTAIFAVVFMWGIFYQFAEVVGLRKGDKYMTLMIIGTVFIGAVSSTIFPFKDMGLFMIGAFQKMSPGFTIEPAIYIIVMGAMAICAILFYVGLMRFVYRPDVSTIRDINENTFKDDNLPPMNTLQKFLLVYMFVFVITLCLPGFLPKAWIFTKILNQLGMAGITLIFFVFLCLLRQNGKSIIDFPVLAKEKIPWDLIFLMASAPCVSGAMLGEGTGIKSFLSQALNPLFANSTPLMFVILISLMSIALTNVANNGVVGMLSMAVVVIFSTQISINTATVITMLVFTCNMAFILPASSVFGAMLHGNTQWLTPKEIYRYTIPIVILCILLVVFVGIPLGNLLYV